MAIKELKSELQSLDKKALINLIGEIYKKDKEARYFLDNYLSADDDKLFKTCKGKVYEAFYPNRGFNLKLADGKKAISDFRNMGASKKLLADLMMFYVETGVQFTIDYGDIDEQFYNSVAGTYKKAIELMKKENHLDFFADRAKKVVAETEGMGWFFHDELSEYYYNFYD